jgi:hypothetical protein
MAYLDGLFRKSSLCEARTVGEPRRQASRSHGGHVEDHRNPRTQPEDLVRSRATVFRLVAPVAVTATLAAAAVSASAHTAPSVAHGRVTMPTITDAGSRATFGLQWASSRHPSSVVVVFHGHGHNAEEWQAAGELTAAAARDNALVIAPETSESTAANGKGTFDTVDEEARDAAVALGWVNRAFHPPATYLLCVSMGCTGMAYFIDSLARPATADKDAAFVHAQKVGRITGVLVSEGLSNLVETWAEANAADPTSQHEIEQETGGTPATASGAYRARSLALLPSADFAALNLKQAAVVHDVDDGLVPVNQPAETRAAFAAAQVPFHGYTVVRSTANGCSTANQTTGTSYVGKYVQQYTGDGTVAQTVDPTLCLAGHATETVPGTPVMKATFDVLHTMTTTGVGRGETFLGVN